MREINLMKFKIALGAATLLLSMAAAQAQESFAQDDASPLDSAFATSHPVSGIDSTATSEAPFVATDEVQPAQAPAAPVSGEDDRFFNIAHAPDPLLTISRQSQVLEQYNDVATLMRDIKKEGNDDAVLALLSALAGDQATLEVFKAVFDTIDVAAPAPSPAPRVAPSPTAQPQENPAPVDLAGEAPKPVEVTPPKPPVPVAPPAPRHPIVPVFAQTFSEQGGREKVIISVGGQRFIGLPGETIRVDGRRITIEGIVSKTGESGRETFTIYISENGVREALSWN